MNPGVVGGRFGSDPTLNQFNKCSVEIVSVVFGGGEIPCMRGTVWDYTVGVSHSQKSGLFVMYMLRFQIFNPKVRCRIYMSRDSSGCRVKQNNGFRIIMRIITIIIIIIIW